MLIFHQNIQLNQKKTLSADTGPSVDIPGKTTASKGISVHVPGHKYLDFSKGPSVHIPPKP